MYNLSSNRSNVAKLYIYDIFNMPRGINKKKVYDKLQTVWDYDKGITLVALMFYTRNIRKNINDTKGKGEKLISYYIVLWLLKNYKYMFVSNYMTFINMGYFKDCLILATMAKSNNMPDDDIMLLLAPMALALANDEEKLINMYKLCINYVENNININIKLNSLNLSLASKWAPRQGKAYSNCIPYLKILCGLTGIKSDMKWRKYIRQIVQSKSLNTIETLLSTKQYSNIDFKTVPNKAFKLYENKFSSTPELTLKYNQYLNQGHVYKFNLYTSPHEILNSYLLKFKQGYEFIKIKNTNTEIQWKHFINNITNLNSTRADNIYIPVIDMSESMFNKKNSFSAKVALTLGVMMAIINKGLFNRKAITFSNTPVMFDIKGNTAMEQLSSVMLNKYNLGECKSSGRINITSVFEKLLIYILENNISNKIVSKIKITIFSNMEFNQVTSAESSFLNIRKLYEYYNITVPQVIYWNLSGVMKYSPCVLNGINVNFINGFKPSLINQLVETGELNPSTIPFYILSKYKPLVCNMFTL
jgi:hypothetical protein